jgi:DNA-binding SARP family transcriptional activator
MRILLAALLLHANAPISRTALAEALWDGAPPLAALESLRSYVRRLRLSLGSENAERIETRAPGYLIHVSAGELDIAQFEQLCREASVSLREQLWQEASDAAARALELWRGEPLADIPSTLLRDRYLPRLEQLCLQALEDQAEADLRLGRHERWVQRLRDLAVQHPLRERFHTQLMMALARSGRQAEALDAYRAARRILINELGVEPGPELRDMHARILSGENEILGRDSRSTWSYDATRETVPRQLPAAARHFTGRLEELDELVGFAVENALSGDGVAVSVIEGMAGVGKTALAVHVAHRVADKFSGGQLFIDLHGCSGDRPPRSPGDALALLLEALGVPRQQIPRDADLRASLYRQRLADMRTLVLLDNAADEAQVRPLIPGGHGSLVLVTSRRRLKGLDDARSLILDTMAEADASSLVRAVAGPAREVSAEDPALAEIVAFCGRLPLALRIAAALLRHRPAWTTEHLADLLRSRHERISVLSDGERDLGEVLGLSYAGLTDAQQHLLRRLGLVLGPDIDAYATALLIDSDRGTATRLLEDLVDHNLLIQQTAGRYQLHDLIRVYAQTLADQSPQQEREAARGRLVDYYRYTAQRADALVTLYPAPPPADAVPVGTHAPADSEEAWVWLRTERPNLLAAVSHASGCGDAQRRVGLSIGLSTLLRVDGPWSTALALHEEAVAAAHELGDDSGRAHALLNLADARAGIFDYPGAAGAIGEALKLYRGLGQQRGVATALCLHGEVLRMTSDYAAAARDLHEAAGLYRELEEPRGQATALCLSGDVHRMTGDYVRAARDLHEALELYRELKERRGEATALNWLGLTQATTEDFPGAIDHLDRALRLYRDLGERRGQAYVLTQLANVRISNQDYEGAEQALSDALRLYRELGERRGQANALALLGLARQPIGGSGERRRPVALHPEGLHATGAARSAGAPIMTEVTPSHSGRAAELSRRVLVAPDPDRGITRFALTDPLNRLG